VTGAEPTKCICRLRPTHRRRSRACRPPRFKAGHRNVAKPLARRSERSGRMRSSARCAVSALSKTRARAARKCRRRGKAGPPRPAPRDAEAQAVLSHSPSGFRSRCSSLMHVRSRESGARSRGTLALIQFCGLLAMADRSFLVADAARLLGSEPSKRSTIALARATLRTPWTLHNSAFRSGRADSCSLSSERPVRNTRAPSRRTSSSGRAYGRRAGPAKRPRPPSSRPCREAS
jgi:hypothetical protein